jgi:asparagine synthase (glutamine-hydrolysing)
MYARMCGIAGIFAYASAAPDPSPRELDAIVARMASRGPDGAGTWRSADARVALGHRRLAIIDPSARGAQPMTSADGALAITYNGEIYNHRELRAELAERGRVFRSESDTEMLLHLYAERGTAMVDALRGMFAFALWDAREGGLWLARDPYGIKPLYCADDGHTFRFASQVKALLAGGVVSRAVDPAGLVGFLSYASVPEPWTIHASVRALPAGTTRWIDARGARAPRRHFDLAGAYRDAVDRASAPGSDPLPEMREAVRDAVRHHLVADVPVGAFLSAGVDSGALVALMREQTTETRTVTLAFDEFRDRADDEAPLAAQVAGRYGADHATRRVTHAEFVADLPRILDAMDQPTLDGVNTWFASKAARERGLKVAVSGLGGDELWGGYPAFRDVPRVVRATRLAAHVPGLGLAMREVGRRVLPRTRHSPKFAGLVEYGASFAGAYFLRRGLFMPWELDALFDRDLIGAGRRTFDPIAVAASALEPDAGTDFARVATLEGALYLRNQLLRDTDWASMAHSVEVRTPLVDTVLLRRVAPLVARGACDGKALLARCPAQRLPDAVVLRAKSGFATPIADWLSACPELGAWRGVPSLARPYCHWSRRLAYALARMWLSA